METGQIFTIVIALAALFVSATGVLVGVVLYVHKGMSETLGKLHELISDMSPKAEVRAEFDKVWMRVDENHKEFNEFRMAVIEKR